MACLERMSADLGSTRYACVLPVIKPYGYPSESLEGELKPNQPSSPLHLIRLVSAVP